jgi:hypothetical protein
MIIEFWNFKHANAERHKNYTCVNVCTVLKVEVQGHLMLGKYGAHIMCFKDCTKVSSLSILIC